MLFNSYSFIFLFAPIVIGGYYWLGKSEARSRFANVWLVLASLYFYAHWNIKYLPLLLLSIAVNYFVSGWIIGNRKENLARTRFAFWSGVFFNVALLGVFKYTDFFIKNINLLGGTFLFCILFCRWAFPFSQSRNLCILWTATRD